MKKGKLREILEQLIYCKYIDSTIASIRELVEGMKKGHQGCVGFIEDDDRYNQAIEDVLKELGN